MSFILAGIVAVIFLVADQVTKYIVATNMELGSTVGFLNGFLDFTFTHNDGGAWGMLGGARWLLLASTAIIMFFSLLSSSTVAIAILKPAGFFARFNTRGFPFILNSSILPVCGL